jgi:Domain of unknown function (DUF4424)
MRTFRANNLLSFGTLVALAAAAVGAPAALANDSVAELSVGGLTFSRTTDVSMESEELKISPEAVTVRYHFLNHRPTPVTLTVAFPLPDIDLSEIENIAFPSDDPVNFMSFETKVNGKRIDLTINQRALLGEKDVTATLRNAGVAVLPIGSQQKTLADLMPAAREKLVGEGLLVQSGTDEKGKPIYIPGWIVRTSAVRQQTFPPQRPIVVEHRYRTSLGVSVDTVLRRSLRQSKGMKAEVDRYRDLYCISPALLSSVDKLAGDAEANKAKLREWRISYILKTGANWAGPIRDFKLVVDTGKSERLVSFCASNIKTLSPSSVGVTASDFTPDKNLDILIIGRQ